MISVNVLYPRTEDAQFDMTYYLTKHIPLVQKLLGAALQGCVVEEGVAGGTPGSPATYSVMCHLRFDSVEAFQAAFGPHAKVIEGDIPNYSSLAPVIQISEIKAS